MDTNPDITDAMESPLHRPPRGQRWSGWMHGLLAVGMLYVFVSAINLMGHGLKIAAKDPEAQAFLHDQVFSFAENPISGLCLGVLITAIVQSSSFTTSFLVGLVAAGQISLGDAIPFIMGANIGTSVTNMLVSMGHIRRRREFRRALAGATVHDFFNLCTVVVLFPLEYIFGILSRPADAFADWLERAHWIEPADPSGFNLVKTLIKPFTASADWIFQDWLNLSRPWAGGLIAIVGVVLLFVSLALLVKGLRGLLLDRLSRVFSRVLFRNAATGFVVGIILTVMVQSSSVTTSLVVPLIGAGVLRLRQIFPYTLGANVGTTVTALLAALAAAGAASSPEEATMAAAGLAAAAAHLLFNCMGTAIFWPLKIVPISMAKGFARVAVRRRPLVFVFVLGVFFVIPIVTILIVNLWR